MKPGPLERLQAIAERNAAQVARDQAKREARQKKAAAEKAKVRRQVAKAQPVAEAKEKAREEQQAQRAAARAAAKKARDAAKRAKLKEAWRIEAAAAGARGEPFENDEAQKVYMAGKRSASSRAARVPDEGDEWDGTAPW
jgi:hypothetical protein